MCGYKVPGGSEQSSLESMETIDPEHAFGGEHFMQKRSFHHLMEGEGDHFNLASMQRDIARDMDLDEWDEILLGGEMFGDIDY